MGPKTPAQKPRVMEKFTPGPWEVGPGVNGMPCVRKRTSEHSSLMLFETYYGPGRSEGEANAHLIAAAPEMYEALDMLVIVSSDPSANTRHVEECLSAAKAALKKARGES